MRVKSAAGSAAANRTPDVDGDRPEVRRRVDVGHLVEVEPDVLRHQHAGEARRVAGGQHLVGELVLRGRAASAGRVEHVDHRRQVEADGPAERQRLAGGGERRGREEVVGQLHRLGHARLVAHPAATVAEAGDRRFGQRPCVVGRGDHDGERAGPGAGDATRDGGIHVGDVVPSRPSRLGPRRADPDGRRLARPDPTVPTRCPTTRRATAADTSPSGRLRTTTSARRAISAVPSTHAAPAGSRSGPATS